jgi:hypothetical protein
MGVGDTISGIMGWDGQTFFVSPSNALICRVGACGGKNTETSFFIVFAIFGDE